ncbi:hypothetical protein [Lysobacter olei]
MAARPRLPQGVRASDRPACPNAHAQAGLARARAALLTTDPAVVTDLDAMAQREQWRRDDEARRTAQRELALEVGR